MKIVFGLKKAFLSIFHKSKKGKTWISGPNAKYTRFNYFSAHDFSRIFANTRECNLASTEQLAVVDYFVTKMLSLCGKTPLFSVQSNVELYYVCKSKSFRLVLNPTFQGKSWKRILYGTRLKSDSNGRLKVLQFL